jgi:hypothetical protein
MTFSLFEYSFYLHDKMRGNSTLKPKAKQMKEAFIGRKWIGL